MNWTQEDRKFMRQARIADPADRPATISDLNNLQWHRLVSGRAAAWEEAKVSAEQAEAYKKAAARMEVSRNNWRVAAYAALALAVVFLMALISATHRSHLCQ
mgnify:CR=1 FL=1